MIQLSVKKVKAIILGCVDVYATASYRCVLCDGVWPQLPREKPCPVALEPRVHLRDLARTLMSVETMPA